MRWQVEVSSVGKTELQKFCVEAESWQRALQAARAQRGEDGPMSGFSIELLEEGYRAVDPVARIKFVVKRAPDDMPITAPLAAGAAKGVAPTPPSIAPPAPVSKSIPPRPGVPSAPISSSRSVENGPSAPAAPVSVVPVAPVVASAPPVPPASAPVSAKKNSSIPPAPILPVGSFVPGLPRVKILSQREQNPTDASPLTYREYSFAVAAGTTEEVAGNVLKAQLRLIDAHLADAKMGKLVNLAVFDVEFTGKPPGPPLATLSWKDWKGDPVLGFPRKGGGPKQVKPPTAGGAPASVQPSAPSAQIFPPPSFPPTPPGQQGGPMPAAVRQPGTDAPIAPVPVVAVNNPPPVPPSAPSTGGPRPTPQMLRAMVQAAKIQSEPRLPNAAPANAWPLTPSAPSVGPAEPVPVPPPPANIASQPPPAPNAGGGAFVPPTNPFTAADPFASNPFAPSASQPPPAPPVQGFNPASVPPPPPPAAVNPFSPASVPPPAAMNPFAPSASQPPPAPVNPYAPSHSQPPPGNPFAAPASVPPPPPAGSFPPPAITASQPPPNLASAPVQAFTPGSIPPPPGMPNVGSHPPPAITQSEPPRRASRPSHGNIGPDGMVRTPSGRFVRGRTTGDELITSLFESMHDLHFLRDALDGGQFCLALATEVLPARAAIIHFFDIEKREWVVACTRGKDAAKLLVSRTPETDVLLRDAARMRRAIVTSNASSVATAQRYQTVGGARSLIIAPIMQAGRALGAMEIINPLDGMPFNDDEGNAVTYIAEQYAEYLGSRGIIVDPNRIQAAASR